MEGNDPGFCPTDLDIMNCCIPQSECVSCVWLRDFNVCVAK